MFQLPRLLASRVIGAAAAAAARQRLCHSAQRWQSSSIFPAASMTQDAYRSLTLHASQLDADIDFSTTLDNALQQWRAQGRPAVWIHMDADHADWIAAAVERSFAFHSVHDGTLILSHWLADGPSRLPAGPTHQVGVGCWVSHPDDATHMLVVEERSGPTAGEGLWKMPTGLANQQEDLAAAAVRELREETSLEGVFQGIVGFRQTHVDRHSAARLKSSDLFFVCRLQVDDVTTLAPCQDEIASVQWMSMEDYCAQERWQSLPHMQCLNQCLREPHLLMQGHVLPVRVGSSTTTTVFTMGN